MLSTKLVWYHLITIDLHLLTSFSLPNSRKLYEDLGIPSLNIKSRPKMVTFFRSLGYQVFNKNLPFLCCMACKAHREFLSVWENIPLVVPYCLLFSWTSAIITSSLSPCRCWLWCLVGQLSWHWILRRSHAPKRNPEGILELWVGRLIEIFGEKKKKLIRTWTNYNFVTPIKTKKAFEKGVSRRFT